MIIYLFSTFAADFSVLFTYAFTIKIDSEKKSFRKLVFYWNVFSSVLFLIQSSSFWLHLLSFFKGFIVVKIFMHFHKYKNWILMVFIFLEKSCSFLIKKFLCWYKPKSGVFFTFLNANQIIFVKIVCMAFLMTALLMGFIIVFILLRFSQPWIWVRVFLVQTNFVQIV